MSIPNPEDIMDIPQQEACPFCGGIRILRMELTEHRLTHSAGILNARFGCDRCGASVYGHGNSSDEAWADAEKKWNKRAYTGPTQPRHAYYITHRRGLFGKEYSCSYCGAPTRIQGEICYCCKSIMQKFEKQKEV